MSKGERYNREREAAALPRWQYVAKLRESGWTWAEIGKELGIDTAMAHRLGQKATAHRLDNPSDQ